MQEKVPYFTISSPYDLVYRKDSTKKPVQPHIHNAAELYFTLSPLPDVLLNNTVSEIPENSLIVIPPFCIHQLYHEADTIYERYILSLNTDWLSQVFCESKDLFAYLRQGSSPLIFSFADNIKVQLIEQLNALLTLSSSQDISSMICFMETLRLLDTQIRQHLPLLAPQPLLTTNAQKNMNQIISYINEHLTEALSLTDLSEHFHMNPEYLSRFFKTHAHTTMSHYIALQRINTAQSLFREGQTITEVQELLGYSSYAYFAKNFKKMTGMTPGEYRRNNSINSF